MSRFNVSFRLAGVPIQIEPSFWLIAAVFSFRAASLPELAVSVGCILVAVLVHEMGHALMSKAFGAEPEVTLYSMGGVTRHERPDGQPMSWGRAALITLAGPMAGFVLAALLSVLRLYWAPAPDSLSALATGLLLFISVVWGVINLVPVLPLDGGNIVRALLSRTSPEKGLIRALWVSVIVGPLTAFALYRFSFWAAFLFGYFSLTAVRQLVEVQQIRSDESLGLDKRFEDAHQALSEGDVERASSQARIVVQQAKTKALRVAASHVLAFAELTQDRPQEAIRVLEALPGSTVDPFLFGACLVAGGRASDAVPYLERAVQAGHHPEARPMLARALEQTGDLQRAAQVRGTASPPKDDQQN